jgi:hypothetical protein
VRRAVAVAALLMALAACGRDQDPGVVPTGPTTGGPPTTSHLLGQCPPGGPDATTPPVGCLGADGKVLH